MLVYLLGRQPADKPVAHTHTKVLEPCVAYRGVEGQRNANLALTLYAPKIFGDRNFPQER